MNSRSLLEPVLASNLILFSLASFLITLKAWCMTLSKSNSYILKLIILFSISARFDMSWVRNWTILAEKSYFSRLVWHSYKMTLVSRTNICAYTDCIWWILVKFFKVSLDWKTSRSLSTIPLHFKLIEVRISSNSSFLYLISVFKWFKLSSIWFKF